MSTAAPVSSGSASGVSNASAATTANPASAAGAAGPAAAPSSAPKSALATSASPSTAPSGASSPDLVQYGASFALVIALLVGLLWALKRLQRGRVFARREQRLQVVESMALGGRHKVALIRVDHREVLVGITATQINTLASWTQPAASSQAAGPEAGADARTGFQADLARARSAFERNRE